VQSGNLPTVRIQAGTPVPLNAPGGGDKAIGKGVSLPTFNKSQSGAAPTYGSSFNKPSPPKQIIKKGKF